MKKWPVVLLILMFGAFAAATASAAQYDVNVTGGAIWADPSGVYDLPPGLYGPPPDTMSPPTEVLGLDPGEAPGVSGPSTGPLSPLPSATAPSGMWNAAGWWEFNVIGSTGSDWNDVFAGGDWFFEMTWIGNVGGNQMPPAIFDTVNTFDNVYGKWYMNNPSVWTYFGLYVHPNTGEAQDPEIIPSGVFAFVAAEPGGNYDWGLLYSLTQPCSPVPPAFVDGGMGTITAAAPVPEPASMLLLGSGLLGLAGLGRKKFFKK